MKKSKTLIIALFSNVLIGGLLGYFVCAFNDWFGFNDLYPALFWQFFIGLTILSLSKNMNRLMKQARWYTSTIFVFISAIVIAYGARLLMYILLGGYVNAFSVPLFFMFVAGNFSQLMIIVYNTEPFCQSKWISFFKVSVGFPIVFLLISFGYRYLILSYLNLVN